MPFSLFNLYSRFMTWLTLSHLAMFVEQDTRLMKCTMMQLNMVQCVTLCCTVHMHKPFLRNHCIKDGSHCTFVLFGSAGCPASPQLSVLYLLYFFLFLILVFTFLLLYQSLMPVSSAGHGAQIIIFYFRFCIFVT